VVPAKTVPTVPDMGLTAEELLHIESLRSYMKELSASRYEAFFAYEPDCLNHLARVSYCGGTMNYDIW
jgi:hypothetical protein